MKLATVAAQHTERRSRPGPRVGLILALILFAASVAFCAIQAANAGPVDPTLDKRIYLSVAANNYAPPVVSGDSAIATATP